MIPVIPIIVVVAGVAVTYAGASVLLMVATATVTLAGAVGYKMVRNTRGGCDLFSTKKCKYCTKIAVKKNRISE